MKNTKKKQTSKKIKNAKTKDQQKTYKKIHTNKKK